MTLNEKNAEMGAKNFPPESNGWTTPVTPGDKAPKIEIIELKRRLGLPSGISLIVGTIVGGGIFISPQGVLQDSGSVGLSLFVWVAAGLISLMGSLCYCELGTLIPKAGGEYSYIRSAFGNLPAFLYTWTSLLIIRPTGLAVMSLTFGTYFSSLFNYCGMPEAPVRVAAAACLVTVLILNCYSTTIAANFQIIVTFGKVSSLFVIILGGVYMLAEGNTSVINSGFAGSTSNPANIALAFYDALFAYSGWNSLNFVTEELKNPTRNLLRANVISICLVITINVMANVSYLSVMTKGELLASEAVAVLWGQRVLMSAAVFIPVAVMISAFGSVNGIAFAAGRALFSAARDSNLPEVLSFLSVKRYTPMPSIVFTISLSMVFVAIGNVSTLINFLSFTAWTFYGMTFASQLLFRVKRRNDDRPYKTPIVLPIAMVLISAFLVLAPIIHKPSIEFLYATLLVLGGIVFYIPFIHFKLRVPGIDVVTMYTQLVLELVPSSHCE